MEIDFDNVTDEQRLKMSHAQKDKLLKHTLGKSEVTDTISLVVYLCNGNPGAANAINQLFEKAPRKMVLSCLQTCVVWDIRGHAIYSIWKDLSGKNDKHFVTFITGLFDDIVDIEIIKKAKRGEGLSPMTDDEFTAMRDKLLERAIKEATPEELLIVALKGLFQK